MADPKPPETLNPTNQYIGSEGERLAQEYLLAQGLRIAAINWRKGRNELDMVAWDGPILVFVEVKTKLTVRFGLPEDALDARKEKALWRAAGLYLEECGHEGEIRFDLIAITLTPLTDIRWFKDVLWLEG